MRAAIAFALLAIVAACGSTNGDRTPTPAVVGESSIPRPRPATAGPLPAGIYFRHHTYDSCSAMEPCGVPRVALLQVVDTPRRAMALAVELRDFGPMYPLVVHTDELGLEDASAEGIAVVAGLFRDAADARAAAESSEAELRIATLAQSDVAFERLYAESDERRQRLVVRVARDRRARAFAAGAIDGLLERQSLEARGESSWLAGRVAALTPLCEIAPASVFLTSANAPDVHWYEWAPARCGDQPAYVSWSDTLLGATVTTDDAGSTILRQIASVECDQAEVVSRPYPNGQGEM